MRLLEIVGQCPHQRDDEVEAPVLPQADVSFRHHPDRGTYVDRRLFRWPYTISRTFRRDRTPADLLTLIAQSISGAIQADDALSQRYHVRPAAKAHVTTPGAAPVYRAPAGMEARDDVHLIVEDGGFLEYMPEPRILFRDSCLSQRIRLSVAPEATAILSDAFVFHRPGEDERFRHFASEIVIERPGGRFLMLERIDLDRLLPRTGKRASFSAFGTLIVAAPPSAPLDVFGGEVEARMQSTHGVYLAVSRLPNDAGLALRAAAHDGRLLRLALSTGWSVARRLLFGEEPAPLNK